MVERYRAEIENTWHFQEGFTVQPANLSVLLSDSFPEYIDNILICVLKMNRSLTGLEQHEGE